MTTEWLAAFVAIAVLIGILGLVELGTLRRIAPLLERAAAIVREDLAPHGLNPGSSVPRFTAELHGGGVFDSAEMLGIPYAVLFLSAGCPGCDELVDGIATGETLDVVLVVVVNDFSELPVPPSNAQIIVVRQEGRAVAQAFQTTATPHLFVVDSNGKVVARRVVNSLSALRQVVSEALRKTRGERQPALSRPSG